MRRLALCLAGALTLLAAPLAFADASPPPPGLEPRDDAMRAWLTGAWVYVPRPRDTGALRAQTCGHSDPHVTSAAGFETLGPYAIRIAFGEDLRSVVTRQVLGGRTGQSDVLVPFRQDHYSVTAAAIDDGPEGGVIEFSVGDGISTILVRLDDTTVLVAEDPLELFQGAWLLTKCPESPG